MCMTFAVTNMQLCHLFRQLPDAIGLKGQILQLRALAKLMSDADNPVTIESQRCQLACKHTAQGLKPHNMQVDLH